MQKDKFGLTWITEREFYDKKSRSDLLNRELKKYSASINKAIDLGCGTGAFLRWCIAQELFFHEVKLIDYDQRLLNSVYTNFKIFLKGTSYILKKLNSRKYLITNSSSLKEMTIASFKKNILNSLEEINEHDLVSLSALSDLLSKNLIRKLFSKIAQNKYIYFSLCFNGKIKWSPTNEFDKYMENNFNKHQLQDKGFGIALGKNSPEYIELTAKKKSYTCMKKDSSWRIGSTTERDKLFQKRYLKIMLNTLKKDTITDKNILKSWYLKRMQKIKLTSSKLVVGHSDIIIKT